MVGVMTGKGILDEVQERGWEGREKAAKATRTKKPTPSAPLALYTGPSYLFQFEFILEFAFSFRISQQGFALSNPLRPSSQLLPASTH